MTADARAAILAQIQAANRGVASLGDAQERWNSLPRDYKQRSSTPHEAMLHLLMHRLRDYDADVFPVEQNELAATIAAILKSSDLHCIVIPPGLSLEILPVGFEFVRDTGLSPAELDRCEGVLTTATVAIAETGTIVLQNAPGQGRRATSLVPDFHLCIVYEEQVVETVAEAIARLRPTAALPTTFISGPSATADIEMTRIKGVHGPRTLQVILIRQPASGHD